MSIKKTASSAGPRVWTVAELGAFYTEHRSELLTHARRVLKDSAKAEEITQDALIKFMLAAPELESNDHALSYLHRTIENLCIDLFRAEGRRPNLVVLDDATAEVEASWQDNGDHSAAMSAAEDAAIIRQALALLSPAERAALVMWEMEGRSTSEIAAELGIKESAVRHTVSRARASLRTVLSTLVINEQTGLTALDALSSTYKKAAELAQKSSKAALSLMLVITAFLGWNSMTGNEGSVLPQVSDVSVVAPVAPSQSASQSPTASAQATADAIAKRAKAAAVNIKAAPPTFFGLNKEGNPTGFTITDGTNIAGKTRISKGTSGLTDAGMVVNNQVITASVGPNILLDQQVTVDGAGTRYEALSISAGIAQNWVLLTVKSTEFAIDRLSNGTYLVSATFQIHPTIEPIFPIAVGERGYDLTAAPKSITTRLILNAGKTQVLAQAIQVNN